MVFRYKINTWKTGYARRYQLNRSTNWVKERTSIHLWRSRPRPPAWGDVTHPPLLRGRGDSICTTAKQDFASDDETIIDSHVYPHVKIDQRLYDSDFVTLCSDPVCTPIILIETDVNPLCRPLGV